MISNKIYGSWWPIQKEKFRAIKRHLGPLYDEIFRDRTVLDIGCGFGYLEKEFKGSFIGVDNDLLMLIGQVIIFPKVLGNGDNLPFKDSCFDSIVSIDTIHLLKSNDFMRVLKQGGFALVSVFFNNENYMEKKDMLLKRIEPLDFIMGFEIRGRENEYVVIAVKTR